MDLRTGEQIYLGNVRECVDLFADSRYLFVIAKSTKSLNLVLKLHVDLEKNRTQVVQKSKKNVTDPIAAVSLPAQPYHLYPDPNRPDALFFEFYKKESMDYQLVRASINQKFEIIDSSILYEQKEPFLFSMQEKACHILHADGSYARYNPECTKADLTLKLPGVSRPISLLINGNDVFATSSHSFHLYGYLLRAPESGVPPEIDLLSRS